MIDPLRSQGNKRSGHWLRTLLALIQAEDLSVHAGNGIHNDRNCLPQRQTASVGTFVASKANDGELVRRDNQDGLSAGAGHVERFFRCRERAVAVQPEQPAIKLGACPPPTQARACLRTSRNLSAECARRPKRHLAGRGSRVAPNRGQSPAHSLVGGNSRTGRCRAPSCECRSCRRVRAAGTSGSPHYAFRRRGGEARRRSELKVTVREPTL